MDFAEIKSRTGFNHYTSIKNALKIAASGLLYMSRLDRMNDIVERNLHNEDFSNIYVASFSHSDALDIPMFYLYGGIDGKGCRIRYTDAKIREIIQNCRINTIDTKPQEINRSMYDVFADWVFYTPRDQAMGYYRRQTLENEAYERHRRQSHTPYFEKRPWWRYENEFRILVKMKEDIGQERVALKFSLSKREQSLSVVFGPETESNEYQQYRKRFLKFGIVKTERVVEDAIRMGLVEKNKKLLEATMAQEVLKKGGGI